MIIFLSSSCTDRYIEKLLPCYGPNGTTISTCSFNDTLRLQLAIRTMLGWGEVKVTRFFPCTVRRKQLYSILQHKNTGS